MRSEWEAAVESTLRSLGVPLEFSVGDLDSAVARSFAAVTVYFGHQQLEHGHLTGAIHAFDSVIGYLRGRQQGPLIRLLAVAHYLRGTAFERRAMRMHAFDDYAMALSLWPDHAGARAGRARVEGVDRPVSTSGDGRRRAGGDGERDSARGCR
jgi:hypothetical protein